MAYEPLIEAPALGEALRIRAPLDAYQPRASFPVGTRVYLKADQAWADLTMDQRVEGWVWCEDRGRRASGEPDLDWAPFMGQAHVNVEREADVPVPGAPLHLPALAPVALGEAVVVVGAQREQSGPSPGLMGHRSLDEAHVTEAQRWNKVAVVMDDGQTWLLERASVAPLPVGGLSVRATDLPGPDADAFSRPGRPVSLAHPIRDRYAGSANPAVGTVGRLSGAPRDWAQAGLYGRVPVVFDGRDLGYLQEAGTPLEEREITRYLDPRLLQAAPLSLRPRSRPRARR